MKNRQLISKLLVSPYKSLKIFIYFTIDILLTFTSLFDTVFYLVSSNPSAKKQSTFSFQYR